MKLNKYHLQEAREWLKDIDFVDADDDDIDAATDEEIERVVRKNWDGGIDDFIAMFDHAGDYDNGYQDLSEDDELIGTYGQRNYEFVKDREWVDDSLETYLGKHDNTELNQYMEGIMSGYKTEKSNDFSFDAEFNLYFETEEF